MSVLYLCVSLSFSLLVAKVWVGECACVIFVCGSFTLLFG